MFEAIFCGYFNYTLLQNSQKKCYITFFENSHKLFDSSAFLPACLPPCLPLGFGFAVNEL